MIIDTLKTLFERDLKRLKEEIECYQNEEHLWKVQKDIANSAGNLCLHLVGNLNTYIGKELGKTNYVRNRELEFSLKDVPRTELLKKIEETMVVVSESLDLLTPEKLEEEYPIIIFDQPKSTAFFLIHLTTHLNYHLGQINYHRRLIDQ